MLKVIDVPFRAALIVRSCVMSKGKTFKISLIVEAFQNLERSYTDLKKHLSGLRTSSRNCLVVLGERIGVEDLAALQEFTEFYFKYRDLKESVSPEELYRFLSKNLHVFKEFARGQEVNGELPVHRL